MGKLNPPRTVTATTTAGILSDSTRVWRERIFRNTDASASVYLGTSTVTSSGSTKGLELKAGEVLIWNSTNDRVYVITASGTVAVSVTEVG